MFRVLRKVEKRFLRLAFPIMCKRRALMSTFDGYQKKCLAALDFDCTIINGFCDNAVIDLLPKDKRPVYQNDGWTLYMHHIFELLELYGVNVNTIENVVKQMKPINGMYELLQQLTENPDFDVIIVSDCNTYFIRTWLEHFKLIHNIKKIIANPSYVEDGLMHIEMYKFQDTCNLSEKSLCKGDALQQFILDEKIKGTVYKPVVYMGDGINDLCPILRLDHGDLACCREGFECADAIIKVRNAEKVKDAIYNIKADTVFWNNGFDILNSIKSLTMLQNSDVQNL